MSQHYPEISPKYEGELPALSPAQNVPEANLFDVIDFAPDETADENLKSKNKRLWCIPRSSKQEENTEEFVPTSVQEKERKRSSIRERVVSTYSMSEHYPEITQPYEGELIELSPKKEIPTSILFDEIDFLIDDETKKFGVPPTWKFWHKSSKTEVDSKEIKVKPQKKAFAKVDRKRLESTYSMSQHYPEISPKYEGELLALSPAQNVPEANLFDIIDFVPDWIKEDDDNKKTSKGWNLWCVPKADSTSTENAEEIPSKNLVERQRKTEQKRERLVSTFSMSKYYPEPEEKYEGELFEIRPATQIPESKLFDEISFLTEDDEETARKHKLSKNWNLCIPLSKEMKAEKSAVTAQEVSPKSETARSAQRPQSPIGQFSFKKTVWTAKSKPSSLEGYPTITTPFSGKINELSKSFELENSDLFESVTFLPKTERIETDIPKTEVQIKKKKLKLFAKKRLSKFGSAMDLSAYPKSLAAMDLSSYPKPLAYDGPLENLGKSDEIGGTPLKIEVVKYHSGYSIPFGKSKFERCRFDVVEETGEAAGDYPGIDFDPASAVPIYPVEHETIAMRSFCPRPVMDKMPQARTPKDARRRTSSKHYESDSDTSSQETEPSDLVQFSKSESFLKFIRNRLNTKNTTKKKTGFENLVEPFSAECPEIKKHEDVGNYPILDHVHVYHNGQSTQQAIDSGFEEAGSADEHKKVANLYLKKSAKPSFLSKFKLSREFNEKTVDDAPEQTELDSSPFLGLYSTVPLQPDVEHVPLISVVTNLPTVTYYDKRSLASPVPTESDETEQKPPAEPKVETKKAKKSKDLHDLYGLSWEKYEGPVFDIGRSKREVEDWPVGEYATVYHCGRSDLPVAEIPDEFYQIPIETDLDMKKSAILHVKTSNESAEQFIENLEAHKHEPEESEGLKVHVNVFRSEVQEPSTSETAKRLSFSERLAVVFKKPKKNYPTIGESFDGEPAEIEPSSDFENQKQQQFVQPEHSQVSKQRKQRKRKLKVNLNDYPFDPEPIDENVSDLMITKDLPRIPAPFSVGSGAIVEKPRRRFRFRRFWRRRRAGEPFAISGINKRDDVSSTLFSTVITDRSLFVAGHWPVTDIDVDVALKRVAQIDCECEANVVLGKSYFDAIGGGKSFGPQGSSSIVQTNRGTNHAKASVLIREKAEPVETARRAAEDCYLDSTLPSDFVQLEDDDDEMRENYLRGLSPSTWRRKFREGGLCRSGSRSPTDSMAHSTTAVSPTNTGGMFASIKRRFSEKLAKKDQKEKEKQRKKQEKEAKKKVKKGEVGYDVETESSSPISDAEIEERHLFISKAVEGPEESLKKARELNSAVDEDNHPMAPQNAAGATRIDPNSGGPYTPAKEKDGRIIKEEREETVYRISGTGHAPKLDPNDMSLSSTVNKCMKETDKVPRVQMVEASVLVTEHEPVPQAIKEGSAPFSTVHTWHETEAGPEQVYTQIDKYGNKITKTVKTQTTKHTIQKQTYQTYAVDGNQPESITKTEETFTPINNDSVTRANVVNTHTRTIAYEKGSEPDRGNEPLGELVSSKTITSGNRTVEILTFKTEKDGVVETRVEHRVTIHSGEDIDHDAELAKALLEATKLSPDMYITQIEMDSSTQN
uniref:Band 4.1 C-terminal domain-containing protein n=1 Tax=Panagrolaimus sp. JU765 TaxID=591449 RepID=A0AC34QVI4_9BILA